MKKFKQKMLLLGLIMPTLLSAPLVYATESSEEDVESTQVEDKEASELQKALHDAVDLFKEKWPEAAIKDLSIELKHADDSYVIEIQGFHEQKEVEVKVNFNKGALEEPLYDEETDHDEDDDDVALDLESLLTLDEVTEIVEKEFPEGKIYKWQLDTDKQVAIWEISLDEVKNPQEADRLEELELKIDAKSGEIVEKDWD